MSAPNLGGDHQEERVPVSVPRRKRGSLRRHWLTGALFFGVMGLAVFTGSFLHEAYQKRLDTEAVRVGLEAELAGAKRENDYLREKLVRMTDDTNMELMARQLGYGQPEETLYQKGSTKGR